MRIIKPILLLVLVTAIFYLLDFFIDLPPIDFEVWGIILTISSILFGFLGAFFISELWGKYVEARSSQSFWSSKIRDVLFYSTYFFNDNKEFEIRLRQAMEKYCIADAIIKWEELEKEEKYLKEIGNTFYLIKTKELKGAEGEWLTSLLSSYSEASESLNKMTILGKEKMFPSEWLIMILLSIIISLSILFLQTTEFFYKTLIFSLPGVMVLIFWLLYTLDNMGWNIEVISFEPYQKILDSLGVKRFYLTRHIKRGIKPKTNDYRTEKDLSGDLRDLYLELSKK